MAVEHPGWKNLGTFLFLLVIGVGNWLVINEIQTFGELLTPMNVGSLLAVLGTVGGAYGLKPPVK